MGFRNCTETTDDMSLRKIIISERPKEFKKEMYICFTTWEKAFERINWLGHLYRTNSECNRSGNEW